MSTKYTTATVEKSSADPRRISFIASHEKVDRDSEVIAVAGIDCTDFLGNPKMLLHHDRKQSVANVDRLRRTTIDGAPALIGEAVFPDRPQSDEALADVRAGLLGAVSIGFKGLELGAPILPGQLGPTYLKSSLIEISLVTLPSCATCLVTHKSATCRCHDDIGLEAMQFPPVEDVLAGIHFPSRTDKADEIDIEDEHEHVLQPVGTITRIIRQAMRESVRETVGVAVKREINYLRGRID